MDECILTNNILHASGLFFFNILGYFSFHNQSLGLVGTNILYFYSLHLFTLYVPPNFFCLAK